MMYKRKRASTRRRYRKRARKSYVPRPLTRRRGTMINMHRTFNYSYWQPSTATTSDFWKFYSFTIQDMPNYTEITNLFDSYRIARIKVKFLPRFNAFDGSNTTDTTLPGVTNQQGTNLHIIVDPKSQTGPTGVYSRANMNNFLESGKVRTYNGNRPVTVYYKPVVSDSLTSGARFLSAPWLPTGSPSPHYGFHAFAQDVNMTGTFGQSWDVFVTFYIQAKGIK